MLVGTPLMSYSRMLLQAQTCIKAGDKTWRPLRVWFCLCCCALFLSLVVYFLQVPFLTAEDESIWLNIRSLVTLGKALAFAGS